MNFIDKKVSVKRAIAILAKNGIQVDEDEGTVILDFLYLMAKNYKKPEEEKDVESLRRNRTSGKTL
ncbi:hypothetical protein [Sphingobacterium suaedae]|uniref:PTS sugar transporter subunit IIBC n=1 Tax=Sphingobacterium suaedae TaxID=1686402 RepID=A0ABW5KME5_9SPHI